MSKITDHKLNNSNYLDWSKTVRLYLRSIDKNNHLTDDPPKDGSRQTWLREDTRLFLQIWNSIDSEVISLINHCKFVKELMEYLEFLYSGKGNISRIYDVCQAFYRAEKQDKSIITYFMNFKKTYEELNLLLPFSFDVKVQQTQREQMAIMSFLAGLLPKFEAAKSQILSSPEISFLQDMFSRVFHTKNTQSVQSSSALVGLEKQQYKGGGKRIDTRGQNAEVVVCHYYHKWDHMKRDCKKLQYRNQRTQSAHIASINDAINHEKSVMISADEFAKFSQYQESLKFSSTPITTIAESGKPNTCLVFSSSKWVIDSGATDHMISNSSLFSTFQPHTSVPTVTLTDGSKSRVLRSGSVNPTPLISLSSVLNLPELSFNLISVSKLTRAFNCSAQFFPDYCLFQDLTTKQIIDKGHESGGLYILDTQIPKFIACFGIVTPFETHFCQHYRVNLSPRVNKRADVSFALVHSDVWGSSLVISKIGFKYFVTFVDDHSLSSLLDPVSSDDLPIALCKGKKAIGSKWIFAIKFNPDGSVARLKTRLVAKGYAQIYGENYSDTFSHVAKDLQEKVYMEQPLGFVAQGESGKVCHLRKSLYGPKQSLRAWFEKFSLAVERFGMQKSKSDHSVFYKQSEIGIILLVVYVDDIVITGNDAAGISSLKTFLHSQFQTKDLGLLKYFLGIEIAKSRKGIFLSQRKYVLDLLSKMEKLGIKPVSTPMIPNLQLTNEGELLEDPGRYRKLVEKLNNLTVTHLDIAYSMLIEQDPKQIEDPQLNFVSLLRKPSLMEEYEAECCLAIECRVRI
ncbi:uncharacterized protein [Coffea arabica]|uniref:Reverse transcriptase Ty1/copia-type domain-containing protein n=1 Tax=Coffea arabica TaxID=13443 RepID=A0ABM4WN60_COFAR